MIRFDPFRLRRRDVLKGIAAAGAVGALSLSPFRHLMAATGTFNLRLLATTDVHVHIHPYDYYRDRPDDTVGLAKTATLIERARAAAPNSLLLDNGDFLQGNPMGDYIAYERGMREGDVHPVVKAMNVLGFEVGTLGNHEFNYGLDFMMKTLAGGDFPFVCANVANGKLAAAPRDDDLLIPPYVILERELVDGAGNAEVIRIGVIGVVPPQIVIWDRAHLEGSVQTRDIVQAVAAHIPAMKEQGADLIVVLSHSGIDPGPPVDGAENASLYLGQVAGIDAIFTGHHHRVFPGETYQGIEGADAVRGRIGAIPAVMAGFWGSHLGIVDLVLAHDGGEWRVTESAVEAAPIYEREGREVRPLVDAVAAPLEATQAEHEATLAYVRRPVGQTTAPINSYFALVADDPSVQIVSQAQLWYVGQILADGPYAELPLLSAAAPFKAGGRGGPEYYTDVAAGDIAIKNVADLYLYPNTVRAVRVDGATVKEWLERSAGIFNQIDPAGGEQKLIDQTFPSYNFDVIDGVTYRIDLTEASRYDKDGNLIDAGAERIKDLRYQGEPIDPAQQFVVATNNYRAAGGGSFPGVDPSKVILEAPDTNRDVIVRYLVEQGTIDPSADDNWSFLPIEGTGPDLKLIFETGPAAQSYVEQRDDMTYLDLTAEGFAAYELKIGG